MFSSHLSSTALKNRLAAAAEGSGLGSWCGVGHFLAGMACPEKWGLNSEPLAGRTFIRQCKYFVKIGGEGGWGKGEEKRCIIVIMLALFFGKCCFSGNRHKNENISAIKVRADNERCSSSEMIFLINVRSR